MTHNTDSLEEQSSMPNSISVAWGEHTYSAPVEADSFGSHGGSVNTFDSTLTVQDYISDNGSTVTVKGMLTIQNGMDVEGGSTVKADAGLVVMGQRVTVGNGSNVTVNGPLVIGGIDMSMVANWRDYVTVQPGSSFTWNPTPVACFLAGTMIRMADGADKAVEDIRVGDMVAVYDTGRVRK